MANDTDWQLRAKVGGELVDLQGKALKKAMIEKDPAAREAYLSMSKAAEEAFLNVVPEARVALAMGVELERMVPDALLALADELDQMAARERAVADNTRTRPGDPGVQQQIGQAEGLRTAANMARSRADRELRGEGSDEASRD